MREPRLLFPILRFSLEEGSVLYNVTASSFTLLEVNPHNFFCKLEEKLEKILKQTEANKNRIVISLVDRESDGNPVDPDDIIPVCIEASRRSG